MCGEMVGDQLHRVNSNRFEILDVLKGIGMCMVIYGHLIPATDFLYRYFFSFHMPLFFLLSGYCYTEKLATRDIWKYTVNRFFKLLIPCWIYVNFFYLIRLPWSDYRALAGQRLFLIFPEEEWFLPTSFMGGILLLAAVKTRRLISDRYGARAGKIFLLLTEALAIYLGIFLPASSGGIYTAINRFAFFRVEHVFVAYSFMGMGFSARNDIDFSAVDFSTPKSKIVLLIFGVFSIYFSQNTGYINLCDVSYGTSVFWFYFYALYSIFAWSCVSRVICAHTDKVKKYLSFVGKNSLYFYILQGLFIVSEPYILGIAYNRVALFLHIWTWEEIDSHLPNVPAILYFIFIMICSSIILLGKARLSASMGKRMNKVAKT